MFKPITDSRSVFPAFLSVEFLGTVGTIPLAFGRLGYINASVMKPFLLAVFVITGNHISVRDLIADAISGFVGVEGPVGLSVVVASDAFRRVVFKHIGVIDGNVRIGH